METRHGDIALTDTNEAIEIKEAISAAVNAILRLVDEWVDHCMDAIEEAAEEGYSSIYEHQVTNLGFVNDYKTAFAEELGDDPKLLAIALEDLSVGKALIGMQALDDMPYEVTEGVKDRLAEIFGAEYRGMGTELVSWSDGVRESLGKIVVPF